VSLGLPLELTLLDFSQTSYSSARASLLQAQRTFESLQHYFVEDYLARLYRWRVSKFINDGQLEKRDDAFLHCWHAPNWPYLDPVKEVQAVQLAIDAGLTTQKRELLRQGIDIDDWREERGEEVTLNKAAGIPVVHSTMVTEGIASTAPDQTSPQVETDSSTDNTQGDTSE
jgi:capsid protein